MRDCLTFYIDGQWVAPLESRFLDVENPATEDVSGRIALGGAADVDRAVLAARRAFPAWSATSREERLGALHRIRAEYSRRAADLADAITLEMGAPTALAHGFQVGLGLGHLDTAIAVLSKIAFEESRGASLIVREPIGVCGLITPWNWPLNQIAVKVFPALATGCTVVLKPSEISPYSAQIFAEIIDAADLPAGVFNLIHGDGPGVGVALSSHPEVDLVSFTGSTRAGVEIARNAAPTIKRVCQELGGKSPNIILDDGDLARNVAAGVNAMMSNSGQSCSAPSRMLVPGHRLDEAISVARDAASLVSVGDPNGNAQLGPVSSRAQFEKIQALIQSAIDEDAYLVIGGAGRPDGLERGYYVKPTIFAKVTNAHRIAREEVFGPVLVILSYDSIADAISIANDTEYGLAAFVAGADPVQARSVARQLRAGSVSINGGFDFDAPFGGYKRSGNGREWGEHGFHEYLEVKAILGFADQPAA